MLINGSRLFQTKILSLHVGGAIAQVSEVIIDPNTLKIIAFRVEGPLIRDGADDILPIASVREFSRLGMIIDSVDELVSEEEIIQIRDVLKLDFNLVGLKVITKKKVKVGTVSDYITHVDTWEVHQLVVQRPLIKAFLDPELIIPRSKIIEVDDYQVVIKDETEKSKHKARTEAPADFVPNFINPFREPDFAADAKVDTSPSNSRI